MPHCILEHSANLLDTPDWTGLLREINRTLADTGLFTAADIKSRVVRHETFVIGDGAPDQAFVTLNLQILSGRPDEVKAELSEALLAVLKSAFPVTTGKLRLSLTVQVTDLHRPSYRRQIST